MNTPHQHRAIRATTTGVVVTVAGFAAIVSYSHIYDLGMAHGESGAAARLLPLSVDGLILAASLVALHYARSGHKVPTLARCMMALGVSATVAANVAYGAAFGMLGAVISAWPAVAFIGSAEMLMMLVRSIAAQPAPEPAPEPAPVAAPETQPEPAPESAPEPAPEPAPVRKRTRSAAPDIATLAGHFTPGTVPSLRQIRTTLRVGQARAQQIQAHILAGAR